MYKLEGFAHLRLKMDAMGNPKIVLDNKYWDIRLAYIARLEVGMEKAMSDWGINHDQMDDINRFCLANHDYIENMIKNRTPEVVINGKRY